MLHLGCRLTERIKELNILEWQDNHAWLSHSTSRLVQRDDPTIPSTHLGIFPT